MSTRRTTRATSMAASSRGASPALTEGDIPATPARRSSRRAGSSTPLPAVASRASTAYGINTTAQPASLKVPEAGEDAENVINNLLSNPTALPAVQEEEMPADASNSSRAQVASTRNNNGTRVSRRGGSTMLPPDVSFSNESGIFGGAGLESSSISFSEVGRTPNTLQPPIQKKRQTKQERERQEQQARLQEIARTPVVERPPVEDPASNLAEVWTQWFYQKGDQALDLLVKIIRLFQKLWAWFKTPLGFLLAGLALSALLTSLIIGGSGVSGTSNHSGSYRWYGVSDLRHNVGQFFPDFVTHPIRTFSTDEVTDLERRIKTAEYDIAYLKKRSDIDTNSISQLEKILPNKIIVKQDKRGNLEITQDFWHALDAKMRAENAYLQDEITHETSKSSSTTDLLATDVASLMEKSGIWEKYLRRHRKTLDTWSGEEFNSRFPEKLKEYFDPTTVVSKADFIEMIRKNWDDTQKEIKSEIRKLSKDLDSRVRKASKAEKDAVGSTREEIKAISMEVFQKQLYTAQLNGIARANLNAEVAKSFNRVNHFSQGTGAAVNPKLTSPNYLFPSMDQNLLVRGLSSLLYKAIPRPNPPEVALQRWEEHGDCWCSPSVDAAGFGPSLAVIMGNYIYPDQIVIEHIPQSGSLEPGAAPKEMEMLALIEDEETYHDIKRKSEFTFQEETAEGEQHPYGFVRIATWTYDAKSVDNIQSFVPQIDLSTFGGRSQTNRLIVRSKTNWGGDTIDYTCLYRVRVNGEIAPKIAMKD